MPKTPIHISTPRLAAAGIAVAIAFAAGVALGSGDAVRGLTPLPAPP